MVVCVQLLVINSKGLTFSMSSFIWSSLAKNMSLQGLNLPMVFRLPALPSRQKETTPYISYVGDFRLITPLLVLSVQFMLISTWILVLICSLRNSYIAFIQILLKNIYELQKINMTTHSILFMIFCLALNL